MQIVKRAGFATSLMAASFLATSAVAPAYANEKTEIRDVVECFPAKNIIKFFSKFDDLKPEKRDTVDAVMAARFDVNDGGALPDRVFFRHDEKDTPFTVMPDGAVPDFASITSMHKDGELCAEDNARAGKARVDDAVEFDVDLDIKFKTANGVHTLAELEDGAKDGKSFYKKMVPGPMKLLVPKMTHVSVTYNDDDDDAIANIRAMKDGVAFDGLTVEPFGDTYVISLDALEDLGADSLSIEGGAYILEPAPSIEKMKSLGFSEEEEG